MTSADCQLDSRHNDWYQLAQGLAGGTYGLQVKTSNAANAGTNAENMFGIQAVDSGAGQSFVHGTERMAMYNNLNGGTSLFYLAQIEAVHAGKTMEIRLFDPGDVGGNAILSLKRPTSGGYVDATFSYTADNGRSGTNVTSIQTAVSGTNLFNNSWITISGPAAQHLRAGRRQPAAGGQITTGLVEGAVRHLGQRQRHDDLGGHDPGQPGPPRRALAGTRPASTRVLAVTHRTTSPVGEASHCAQAIPPCRGDPPQSGISHL